MVRPRGWHLDERHVTVEGRADRRQPVRFRPLPFHNARAAIDAGSGPYFYLPKLESRHEAALWSDVFAFAEERLGSTRGTIKATVLIETLPAAFEMDEILYALKDNIVGLNCGRWDYIFSYIKRLGRSPDRLTPDRSAMTMDKRLPRRLFAAPDRHLPPPRRLRHGRHVGLHPGQGRRGGQPGRAGQGPRRQAARGRQRP